MEKIRPKDFTLTFPKWQKVALPTTASKSLKGGFAPVLEPNG